MTPAEVISRVVAAFTREPKVRRIVLFGSRARGDSFPRSDIDLAVSAPGATAAEWRALVEVAEQMQTLLTVDLVRLEHAPAELRARIEREGKVLYEREEEHAGA